jgi:O-antigen ligase
MKSVIQGAAVSDGMANHRLLNIARGLVVILPVCYLLGRVPTDVAVSLVALLFLARSIVQRDWSWTRSGWLRIALVLWAWTLFVSALALDPHLSFQQSLFWWRFLIFAAALEWWVMDEVLMRRLLMVATAVVTAVAVDTWVQYFTSTDLLGHPRPDETRLTGPFDDKRVGSWLMRLMFPVVLGGITWHAWKQRQNAAGVLLAVMILIVGGAIAVSGERMATGLTVLGLAIAVFLLKGRIRWVFSAGLGILLVTGLVIAATNHHMVDRYVSQTAQTAEDISASSYGTIWRSALHIFARRPLVGVGLKNFRVACDDPTYSLPASETYRCETHPHNLYLEWLVGSGGVGFTLFLALVTAWARRLVPPLWRGSASPWLYGPAIMVFLILWPIGPTGSFFSNWYGGVFYLSLGWALATVRLTELRAGDTGSAEPSVVS